MQCHEDKAELILTRSPPAARHLHQLPRGPRPAADRRRLREAATRRRRATTSRSRPSATRTARSCHNPHAPSPEGHADRRARSATRPRSTQVMRDGPEGHAKDELLRLPPAARQPAARRRTSAPSATPTRPRLVATAGPAEAPRLHLVPREARVHDHGQSPPPARPATAPRGRRPGAPDAFVISTGGPHQGDCKRCHTLHGSPGRRRRRRASSATRRSRPSSSRPTRSTPTAGRATAAHARRATRPPRCAGCHEDKAAVAAKWPPASAHAKACNGCHQPHDVRDEEGVRRAATQQEAASAPGGKHQCTQCHPPHEAPPGHGAGVVVALRRLPRGQGRERQGARPDPLGVQELPPAAPVRGPDVHVVPQGHGRARGCTRWRSTPRTAPRATTRT